MERRKELKRTPIKRTPMKHGTKALPKESPKRKVDNTTRRKVLAKLRHERHACEAQAIRECLGDMHDGHEILTRSRGGSITDPDNILMVCRLCHTWITEHPREADCGGFTVPRGATSATMQEARVVRELWKRGKPRCSSWCKVDSHKANGLAV